MLLATSGPYTPRPFPVPKEGGMIGRSRKCRISLLHDCVVSHNHAVIEPGEGGSITIRDVGSTFGTYLNDKRLSEPKRASEPHKLKAYDTIKVGQTSLRWRPSEMIYAAVDVAVPPPLRADSWEATLHEVPSLQQKEVQELVEAISMQEASRKSLYSELSKHIMPVDLPFLFRRVEQVPRADPDHPSRDRDAPDARAGAQQRVPTRGRGGRRDNPRDHNRFVVDGRRGGQPGGETSGLVGE